VDPAARKPEVSRRIRVLIVDDQLLFAQALSVTIEEAGYTVVAVASNPHDGPAFVREHEPDLVLFDIAPVGIVAGRAMLDARPQTKVVALTVLADEQTEREALGAGFSGYLLKHMSTPSFIDALNRIASGERVGVSLAGFGAGHGRRSPEQLLATQLSRREMQVLELIVAGGSNREIARRLGISPNTVRSHTNAILSKLQVRSSLEAAAFAVRTGLVRNRRRARDGNLPA
jgi:DNA-binding NarL/FixJ family response regulator